MLLTHWLKSAPSVRRRFRRKFQKLGPSLAEVEVLEDRCLLATFTVNTLVDDAFGGGNLATETNDGTGLSLREAVGLANATDGVPDDIRFAQELLNTSRVITLTNGQITISDDVTIRGPSFDPGGILVSGNNNSRIFNVTSTADNVTLQFFTITQGNSSNGGGLFNQGPNTILTDMVVSANQGTNGGGLANEIGVLQIFRSRIISNSASNLGGGISNSNGGTVTINDTTIASNVADGGGGVLNDTDATQTIINNSTLSHNTASNDSGGGVLSLATNTSTNALQMQNSTIAGNVSQFGGGGIRAEAGTVLLINLTIANNIDFDSGSSGAGGLSRTGGGTVRGMNLVIAQNAGSNNDNINGAEGTVLNASTGSDANRVGGNPMLGPLQDNGGLTFTMLPLPGSPVLGAGTASIPGTIIRDQRGFARRASATGSGALGGASAGADQGATEFFPTVTQPYVVGPGASNGTLGNQTFDAAAASSDSAGPPPRLNNNPYPGFTGDIRVALADINGDGTKDIITGPGPGGGPNIVVRSGVDPSVVLRNFNAYDPNYFGGVFVAAGDINGDGVPDIITGPSMNSSNVRVFNGADVSGNPFPAPIASVNPFGNFPGGVSVASGDINSDGRADIIIGSGPGAAHVVVFSGATVQADPSFNSLIAGNLRSFFPYGGFPGGVFVASGDVNGDGTDDVITGAGPGGGPHVLVFTNASPVPIASFFAYNVNFGGGVRVGSVDFDGDKFDDVITGAGPGGGPHVRIVNGRLLIAFATANDLATFFPFAMDYTGGVFVAGSKVSPSGGSPLRLAEGVSPAEGSVSSITNEDLTTITEAAIARLEDAGASDADLARLENAFIQVADLNGDLLGLTLGDTILIDANAAGLGFFIDATPEDDIEFQTATGQALDPAARDRVDLLSVVVHELAHVLGLPDLDSAEDPDHFLADRLGPGIRRFVREEDLNALDAAFRPDSLDVLLD